MKKRRIKVKMKKTTKTREELRKEMHVVRPPRLEGKVKEAMMQPVKKKGREKSKKSPEKKES